MSTDYQKLLHRYIAHVRRTGDDHIELNVFGRSPCPFRLVAAHSASRRCGRVHGPEIIRMVQRYLFAVSHGRQNIFSDTTRDNYELSRVSSRSRHTCGLPAALSSH